LGILLILSNNGRPQTHDLPDYLECAKVDWRMSKNGRKKNGKQAKTPEFVKRAERAFRRAARKLRAEHRRLGLPLIIWKNGKSPPDSWFIVRFNDFSRPFGTFRFARSARR